MDPRIREHAEIIVDHALDIGERDPAIATPSPVDSPVRSLE